MSAASHCSFLLFRNKVIWAYPVLWFTLRFVNDVQLSLSNSKFGVFVDRIHPTEFLKQDTTDTTKSASNLEQHIEIDSEGQLIMKIHDKRDDLKPRFWAFH